MTNIKKVLLASLFLLAISVTTVQATVGGSVVKYDFKYNPADESVYYIQLDNGGRGCPPELKKISLNTGSTTKVYSCDEGEELIKGDWDKRYLVNQKISEITSGFKDLVPLNLRKNNFGIDISFLRDNYFENNIEYKISSDFNASIFQNGKKVTELVLPGCNLDQPFIFDGFAIPGFDKKIILLLSAKNDCMEGGYVSDSLYVVGGVDNLDKTYYSSGYKGQSPIQPGEGSLVVYENNSISQISSDNTVRQSYSLYFIISLAFLVIGFALGKITKS